MSAVQLRSLFNALTPGASFRQYKLLEQIGVGGEGVVWSALGPDQTQIHAIKFKDLPDVTEADELGDKEQLEKLIRLRQTYILPITEYGFEAHMRFTVSPYLAGGTLLQKIRVAPLTFAEILRYGMEIASALDYLHAQGVIHRDLKSQNILLDLRNHCYLADFGLAKLVSTSTLAFHTGHGTPPYASPEQIQSRALTPKSDLYSFGVLLYEMFTGQLPWNGKKQLSVEQLNSDQELPDPREFNENLPFVLADILRRVTAANPVNRPASASEIMQLICRVFNISAEAVVSQETTPGWDVRDRDVEDLLKRAFAQWNASNETFNLGLTKFALIQSRRKNIDLKDYRLFMLSQSLTYAYSDEQWWQAVRDPGERLSTAARLLRKRNESITGRIVTHLTNDQEVINQAGSLPDGMTSALLETGLNTDNAFLRREIFSGLRKLMPAASAWNGTGPLDEDQAKRLGEYALEDSEAGDTAAELIGHMRSALAVRVLLRRARGERKIPALLLVQQIAGGLPNSVPNDIRFKLSTELIIQRLVQSPVSLVAAYVSAFLGSSLSVALQVYLTYNLPDFMDTARITTSLTQGLIIGTVFGLGIFVVRVAMERFQPAAMLPRLLAGTVLGGIGMNIAMLIFHILFLNTPPGGLLITATCGTIALTFAMGGFFRSRLLKMILTSFAIFVGIVGTWWLHVQYAPSLTALTPLFRYDYAWSMGQVAATALIVALPTGVLGNLINLTLVEE